MQAFDWHDAKHQRNLRERGIGFDEGAAIFEGRVVAGPDERRDYGEIRVQAIGQARGRMLMVIYTDRGPVRWIISVRPANRKERKKWHE